MSNPGFTDPHLDLSSMARSVQGTLDKRGTISAADATLSRAAITVARADAGIPKGVTHADVAAYTDYVVGNDWTNAIKKAAEDAHAVHIPRQVYIDNATGLDFTKDRTGAAAGTLYYGKAFYSDATPGALGPGATMAQLIARQAMPFVIKPVFGQSFRGIEFSGSLDGANALATDGLSCTDDELRLFFVNIVGVKRHGMQGNGGRWDLVQVYTGSSGDTNSYGASCSGADWCWIGGRAKGGALAAFQGNGSQMIWWGLHLTGQPLLGGGNTPHLFSGSCSASQMLFYGDSGTQDAFNFTGQANQVTIKDINASALDADLTYYVITNSGVGNVFGPIHVTAPSNGNRWLGLLNNSGNPAGVTIGPGYIVGVSQLYGGSQYAAIAGQIYGDADNPNRGGYAADLRTTRTFEVAANFAGPTQDPVWTFPTKLWLPPNRFGWSAANAAAGGLDAGRYRNVRSQTQLGYHLTGAVTNGQWDCWAEL